MSRRLVQYMISVRGVGGVLVLAFIFLPYCVDIAWYGDLTPTHFAQESIDGKEVDPSTEKAPLPIVHDQVRSIEPRVSLQTVASRYIDSVITIKPSQYLLLFSLTSRPPPIL